MYINTRQLLNWMVTVTSAIACLLLTLVPIPGMELFGIGPNWPLIWLVAWSLRRSLWEAIAAGSAIGLLLDSLTAPDPSHVFPYVGSAVLTVFLSQLVMKNIQEDFISVALIVFGMAIWVELFRALQFGGGNWQTLQTDLAEIWSDRQRIALSCALLSSLWAPVIYFPLSRWWKFQNSSERSFDN
ncbi:rod shape-determining protein MreD [Lyngbya sp. CCY1209]|uniref:rod shape-determining protein MreD n=1 Tax=Lyngbya sp. CCY1209 TaxID=2886103 RepID=UPI002D212026|nr:rod shape-determining protein MreD [Lyngbya sp. CCY1209]MEB3885475.1 rod shape-determining protein MreD [Lyngbya sp. CCY1209]